MTPEQLMISILKEAFSGQLIKDRVYNALPKVKKVEFKENPFDIPEEWFWSCLGYCCEMYTGNSISECVKKAKYAGQKEGYDYIATKDVSFEHVIEYDNGVRIPKLDNFRIAYNGSVLMCIEGGSAGRKIGILDKDVCFGNKLCSFNSKEILNKYIYYYLQSHEFKSFFMDSMSGIIGGVSIKKLKGLPIPIPPLEEQHRIVSKIEELLPFVDRYAESYEKLKKINAKFQDDMKKSILQYAMQGKLVEQRAEDGTAEELYKQIQDEKAKLIKDGKIKKEKSLKDIPDDELPFDIPESWKWVRIPEIATSSLGKTLNKKTDEGEDVQYLCSINVYWDGIKLEQIKTAKFSEKDIEKYALKNGDLLVCEGGDIGRCAVWDRDEIMYYQNALHCIKLYGNINPLYIKYCMKFFKYNGILDKASKGMTIKHLVQGSLYSLLFPLPPLMEQHRIVAKIDELFLFVERYAEVFEKFEKFNTIKN